MFSLMKAEIVSRLSQACINKNGLFFNTFVHVAVVFSVTHEWIVSGSSKKVLNEELNINEQQKHYFPNKLLRSIRSLRLQLVLQQSEFLWPSGPLQWLQRGA